MMFKQSFNAHAGILDGPLGLFIFKVFRCLLHSYRLIEWNVKGALVFESCEFSMYGFCFPE